MIARCVTASHKNRSAPCLTISVAPCLPMPKPRALPESLGSGLCLRAAAVRSSSVIVLSDANGSSSDNREETISGGHPRSLARKGHSDLRRRRQHRGNRAFEMHLVTAQRERHCHRRANVDLRVGQQRATVAHARRLDLTLVVRHGRTIVRLRVRSQSTLVVVTFVFFSFVEATSRFLGSYEKALASFSSFWNVIRLPVTRSVGLKGQGGPGVSETRGGACDVIVRRHEASPRVTERPSATLRLRHPGAPAPDKKRPASAGFWFCFSQGCGGWESFCVEAGLWAPTSPAVGGSAIGADRRPHCSATFPGISPVVCDMTQWRNW